MAYPNPMNMYDWIDTWQQAWRAPSAVLGAFARGLDDRPAGPQFAARVNKGCAHCPVRLSCPAHTAPGERP